MFDPVYFIFVLPAMLLGLYAQMKVKSAYAQASQIPARSGLTGAEVAAQILRSNHITNVGIEVAEGFLGDHYDPKAKMLRLSNDVYYGRSLASLGIAAHEVGHAIQDAQRYGLLVLRNGIVPLASVGGNVSMALLFIGMMLASFQLLVLGIALFSLTVIFQIVNLPVEFDASRRARQILTSQAIISPQEDVTVKKVLNAAALTYVAATITAIATLLYYLFRAGLIGGSSDDD